MASYPHPKRIPLQKASTVIYWIVEDEVYSTGRIQYRYLQLKRPTRLTIPTMWCTLYHPILLFQVRSQVGRLATAGYGLSSASWMASDLMGLGWLLPSLDNDTLAGIPPPAMDGVSNCNLLTFWVRWVVWSWINLG